MIDIKKIILENYSIKKLNEFKSYCYYIHLSEAEDEFVKNLSNQQKLQYSNYTDLLSTYQSLRELELIEYVFDFISSIK